MWIFLPKGCQPLLRLLAETKVFLRIGMERLVMQRLPNGLPLSEELAGLIAEQMSSHLLPDILYGLR